MLHFSLRFKKQAIHSINHDADDDIQYFFEFCKCFGPDNMTMRYIYLKSLIRLYIWFYI